MTKQIRRKKDCVSVLGRPIPRSDRSSLMACASVLTLLVPSSTISVPFADFPYSFLEYGLIKFDGKAIHAPTPLYPNAGNLACLPPHTYAPTPAIRHGPRPPGHRPKSGVPHVAWLISACGVPTCAVVADTQSCFRCGQARPGPRPGPRELLFKNVIQSPSPISHIPSHICMR